MKALRILIVEDLPTDVEIARRSLKKENIHFTDRVVDTAEDFKKALAEYKPDLIISDYTMPRFDGMSALKITRSQPQYLPFIVLTGSMNEETAVACMKAGADDYVLKEQIRRLPFAVKEVMQKDRVRKEREQVAGELHRSEERYHLLVQSLMEGLIQVDNDDRILYVNQALCDIFGFTEKELTGTIGYETIILPEDQEEIKTKNKTRPEKPSEKYEIRGRKKTGEIIWLSISGSAIKDEEGHVVGSVGLLTDITDRKKAEEALRESEEKFQTLISQAPEALFLHKIDGSIVEYNQITLERYGYSAQEILQLQTSDIDPDFTEREDHGLFWKELNKNKQLRFEARHRKKDGTIFPVEVSLSPVELKGDKYYLALAEDITHRKLIEKELRIKEKSIESSQNAIALADLDGNLTYVNPAFLRMWGYKSKDEVLGKPSVSFWSSEKEAQKVSDSSSSKGLWEGELLAKRKDGSTFIVLVSANLVKDDEGNPLHKMASFIDITDRKQAEDALKNKIDELERFHKLTVGREFAMVELKKEINELLEKNGQPAKYGIVEYPEE